MPSDNLDANFHLKAGAPIEPLILRATAGECIDVTLTNLLDPAEKDINGQSIFNNPNPDSYPSGGMPPISIYPSARAGLHAQQLDADVTASDGTSVGTNPNQTAAPKGGTIRYTWYAGKRDNGRFVPAELGVVNLLPADPIEQPLFGAVGALVIEPRGARWRTDAGRAAAATVFAPPRVGFREFVGVWQTQIDCTYYPPAPNCQGGTAPNAQLTEGLNYRAEPVGLRVGADADISNAYSDTLISPRPHVLTADPQTPVYWASSGMPVRFRFVNPGGQVALTEVFGHHWQEEPWQNGSTRIGDNPQSQTMGAVILGSNHALNLVVDQVGVPGDYLYRNFIASPGNYAMWGVFRVGPRASDVLALTEYQGVSGGGGDACRVCDARPSQATVRSAGGLGRAAGTRAGGSDDRAVPDRAEGGAGDGHGALPQWRGGFGRAATCRAAVGGGGDGATAPVGQRGSREQEWLPRKFCARRRSECSACRR